MRVSALGWLRTTALRGLSHVLIPGKLFARFQLVDAASMPASHQAACSQTSSPAYVLHFLGAFIQSSPRASFCPRLVLVGLNYDRLVKGMAETVLAIRCLSLQNEVQAWSVYAVERFNLNMNMKDDC